MAKTHRSRRNGGLTIPIAVVAGMLPGVASIASKFPEGGLPLMAQEAGRIFTGYDYKLGQWNIGWMKYGALPLVLGALAHKIIGGRLGVNRALSSAGIPFIRF